MTPRATADTHLVKTTAAGLFRLSEAARHLMRAEQGRNARETPCLTKTQRAGLAICTVTTGHVK